MGPLSLQYVPGTNGPGFYTIARDEATFQLLDYDDEHPYISPAKKVYYIVKAICLGPFNKY